MKFASFTQTLKLIASLIGAISFTLTISPTIVQAQPTTSKAVQSAALADVNLSAQQKAQVNQLYESARSQVWSILTPAQQNQLQAALRGNTTFPAAIAAMQLSQKQLPQLQKVLLSSRQRAETILTPKQFQQVCQNMETYFENHQISGVTD
ncbi:MAG: hypothetical protein JOZ78_25015 [Chroococcidiopsidaceae cyanobacterium CP_BM_ER_R8_30]|nr:hypothetical protein [Chroococcidiopsidaceae cyanobacterium CP_BM_ER_R8_30]